MRGEKRSQGTFEEELQTVRKAAIETQREQTGSKEPQNV